MVHTKKGKAKKLNMNSRLEVKEDEAEESSVDEYIERDK